MSSISTVFKSPVDPITPTTSNGVFSQFNMSLSEAVEEGNLDVVSALLGDQENMRKLEGIPLLIKAICNNQKEIAELLTGKIDCFNDAEDRDVVDCKEKIRSFFSSGESTSTFENLSTILLRDEMYKNNLKTIQLLIQEMSVESLDTLDEFGDTVLHHSAVKGQTQVVNALINQGVALNKQHKETGQTPLIYAIQCGCEEIAIMLINKMSYEDLTIQDKKEQWTAEQYAISIGQTNIVKAITERLKKYSDSR